jgi:hypothetical protein
MREWPFLDPKNTVVFTSSRVVEREETICYVTHDEDDGAWQFHPSGGTSTSEARLVGLGEIVGMDPTIAELADLPLGWRAWRATAVSPWQRAAKTER